MLDRANFSSPPSRGSELALFTLAGRHKIHRKAQSEMSQQVLTQTPRREERAAAFSSPALSRRAVGGRGTRTLRLPHTAAERRATPRVPAPPGMPPCDTWMTRLRTFRLRQLPYTAPTRQDTAIASKGGSVHPLCRLLIERPGRPRGHRRRSRHRNCRRRVLRSCGPRAHFPSRLAYVPRRRGIRTLYEPSRGEAGLRPRIHWRGNVSRLPAPRAPRLAEVSDKYRKLSVFEHVSFAAGYPLLLREHRRRRPVHRAVLPWVGRTCIRVFAQRGVGRPGKPYLQDARRRAVPRGARRSTRCRVLPQIGRRRRARRARAVGCPKHLRRDPSHRASAHLRDRFLP